MDSSRLQPKPKHPTLKILGAISGQTAVTVGSHFGYFAAEGRGLQNDWTQQGALADIKPLFADSKHGTSWGFGLAA